MKKLLTALCLAAFFVSPAQTLFTYGKEKVSADDFLRAFQKNNQGPVTEKALKEYLDLYIASRLKIEEAKERRYDTLPQLKADLANLRQQILPSYLNDKESVDKLANEAFTRSQKDIHVAHIFIKIGNSEDEANQKKEKVLAALNKGQDFASVAKELSDDPSAKTNGGDIGWITVFSLPYEVENLAYSTPVGKASNVYRSNAGYHIIKNLGERKAVGRMKALQILLALPPNSSEEAKAKLKEKADSLYKRLQAGDDFGRLATAFSNDVISAASNGQMPEFGVGEYDPSFENIVYELKEGTISKPFLTTYGYHIVKLIKHIPVATKLDDAAKEALRKRVEQSDRIKFSKKALAEKIVKQAGYQKLAFNDNELWAYSDSVLSYQVPKIKINLKPTTPILKVGNHTSTVNDWIAFAQVNRYRPDGSGAKPYPQVWNEFIQAVALEYYQDHLETYNEEFRRQINEFADGNLFFEIMQREVWTPAQTDSAALVKYYQKNKDKYVWKESADAVIFYAANENAAKEFYNVLRKNPADWKATLTNYAEQITADSNRFELAQIPKEEKQQIAAGTVTSPVLNKADNTASFAYVIRLHNNTEPRNFTEAKGLVINDYQSELEKEWLAKLRKKYPVTINEKTWREIAAHRDLPGGKAISRTEPR